MSPFISLSPQAQPPAPHAADWTGKALLFVEGRGKAERDGGRSTGNSCSLRPQGYHIRVLISASVCWSVVAFRVSIQNVAVHRALKGKHLVQL